MRQLNLLLLFLFLGSLNQCTRDEEQNTLVPTVQFPVDISGFENSANSVFEFPLVLDVSSDRDVTVYYET